MARPITRHSLIAACATAALALGGCAGGVGSMRVHVVDTATGEPVEAAHVRSVSLDTGLVPLPLTDRTFREALATDALRTGAYTDARGVATLRVLRDRPHLIEVNAPLLRAPEDGPDDTSFGRWLLGEDGRTLVAISRETGRPVESDHAARYTLRVAP
ncbi:MAG: hypothetical protein EA379_03145 [Phycisphaerales bacterium]|nr:MAG: hypothetical protein EA379_03145 [Phycisphaerales bacterium]